MTEPLPLIPPTDTEGQRLTAPTAWPEITLAQYLALRAPAAPWVAVLTGLSPEQLATLPEATRAQLLDRLMFVLDDAPLRELLPTPGLYEVCNCSCGLLLQAQRHAAAHPEASPLAFGAYLHALYSTPAATSVDEQAVAAAHAAVLARPVTEVYADAAHFLASYERCAAGIRTDGPIQPGLSRIMKTVPAPKWTWLWLKGRLWPWGAWGPNPTCLVPLRAS
ncbi:hypothetical protein BEN47_05085 [Hymenobacter lapidarius]|uniref:Uncharacterized protein n=1 Tax=Hymenobacter lapidarius TaxID=1908237 RepID=A0A1G1STP5_9BACT|nr:hypothetical protein BEN47_05085 [Hymenobacter lapidarius]